MDVGIEDLILNKECKIFHEYFYITPTHCDDSILGLLNKKLVFYLFPFTFLMWLLKNFKVARLCYVLYNLSCLRS